MLPNNQVANVFVGCLVVRAYYHPSNGLVSENLATIAPAVKETFCSCIIPCQV